MRDERRRRWRLALGPAEGEEEGLEGGDARIDAALSALYVPAGEGRSGGLGRSAPRVARWLGDIREFFPASVVQVVQKDALERLGLKRMLLEPELLAVLEADVHLVADLVSLRAAMPERAKAAARAVVEKVVAELMARLEQKMHMALRGATDRSQRSRRPRPADMDWPRTIQANLRHYQPELRTVIPERLIGHRRRRRAERLDDVILCMDQSGSMAGSVVYASVFAAVLASAPSISTRLVAFDTAVLDLSADLEDPVETLFGVQLGGGTDINQALAYCERLVREPRRTHLVLVTDLFEGGDAEAMLGRAEALLRSGVNLITLLALDDAGKPASNDELARRMAALGSPVFACTPDLFPELMAAVLRREDIGGWAASRDIRLVRPPE